jgi:hypothetical protein
VKKPPARLRAAAAATTVAGAHTRLRRRAQRAAGAAVGGRVEPGLTPVGRAHVAVVPPCVARANDTMLAGASRSSVREGWADLATSAAIGRIVVDVHLAPIARLPVAVQEWGDTCGNRTFAVLRASRSRIIEVTRRASDECTSPIGVRLCHALLVTSLLTHGTAATREAVEVAREGARSGRNHAGENRQGRPCTARGPRRPNMGRGT